MTPTINVLAISALAVISACAQPSKIYVLTTENGSRLSTYNMDGSKGAETIDLARNMCSGIAVDSAGKIYLSHNQSLNQITTYSPDGRPGPVFNPGSAHGIGIGPAGQIYVLLANAKGAFVRMLSPEGRLTPFSIVTAMDNAHMTVGPDGKIYMLSEAYQRLRVFYPDGQPTGVIITAGLNVPHVLAVAPDGRIYVGNDGYISTYLPDGQRIPPTIQLFREWGRDSAGALAVDSAGRLYAGGNNGGVQVYNPDGTKVGPMIETLRGISGIALH